MSRKIFLAPFVQRPDPSVRPLAAPPHRPLHRPPCLPTAPPPRSPRRPAARPVLDVLDVLGVLVVAAARRVRPLEDTGGPPEGHRRAAGGLPADCRVGSRPRGC